MEATVLSVGKSVLNGVLRYAKSAVAEEVALQLGVRRDHLFITNELEMIQAFLMSTQDEGDDNMVVKVWVKQVRDVAYDVEDSLQDFAVRLEMQSWWRRILLKDRHQVAKQMKQLIADVEDVSQRNMRYHLIKGSAGFNPASTDLQSAITGVMTMSSTDEARRQREKAKGDFVELIRKMHARLRVIAVWGTSCDIGEASIIRRAFEDLKKQRKFDCHAWIKVVCPFNSVEFMRSIIRQFYANLLQEAPEKANICPQVLMRMGRKKEIDLPVEFKAYMEIMAKEGAMGEFVGLLASTEKRMGKLLPLFKWKHSLGNVHIHIKEAMNDLKLLLEIYADSRDEIEVDEVRDEEVRLLCYEVDDTVDDLVLRIIHQVYYEDGIKRHVSKFGKFLLFEKLPPRKIRLQRAEQICMVILSAKIRRVCQDLMEEKHSSNRSKKVDPRLLMIHKDASELVGVDGPALDLVNCLKLLPTELGGSFQQTKVVWIVGCAGSGKTALAKRIYDGFGQKFQHRAFVSASKGHDIAEIIRSILSQFDIRDSTEIEDPSRIISQIRDFLREKRYFIIIDDIWDIDSWNTLEHALCRNSRGSIIMTTTRRNDVAKQCFPSKGHFVYKIQPLSLADSKMLFLKQIFGCEENCPPDMKEATDDILKKCEGLPLAINAISNLLSTGPTEEEWDRVRSSFYIAPGENTYIDAMYDILSLSYSELPRRLRDCLLYLTMFPEGCHIERERLVNRWISEGLICSPDGEDLVELGQKYICELVNRSLIESVGMQYDCKARFYRVYNVVRNFLISRYSRENFCTLTQESLNPENKLWRLSLMGGEDPGLVEQLDLSQGRSLGVFGHVEQLPSLVKSYYLRVLDLQDCSELGNHHVKDIGRNYRLRYLNISGTDISELPIQTGGLQYLETLDASFTELVELPGSITRLDKLVRLFVSDETKLPDDIGNMSLQELGDINTFKQSLNFLKELGKLSRLRKLGIIWDSNGISQFDKESYKEKKLVSSLCKLDACRLDTLRITFYLRDKDGFIGDPFLPALKSIREVFLRRGRICWISKWLGSLAKLEKLYVSSREEIDKQDLHMIGCIQPLLEFRLYSGFLGPITISGGFQKLERLELKFSFSHLKFEVGAMPNLKKLDLHIYLSKFKSAGVGFDFGIQHLSSLVWVSIILFCEGVSAAYVEAAEGSLKRMASEHPNLPTIKMIRESTEFMSHDA